MKHEEMEREIERLEEQLERTRRRLTSLQERVERLERIDRLTAIKLEHLEATVENQGTLIRAILRYLRHHIPHPSAGTLTATFSGDCSMNAVLIATLPVTRQDGSALAAADIASITFQKMAAGASQGPVTLVVNTAADPTVGLTLDQLTTTDTSSNKDDAYNFFVTDTAGNVGATSNSVANPGAVAPPISPPAAGTLAGTFS